MHSDASAHLTLPRYAAVKAALAEGFPLAEVLEVEDILPTIYQRSDEHWQARLTRAREACGPLYDQYEAALAAAEDALARKIEPIDSDVAAWAAFQSALAAAPGAEGFLAAHKLGPNDLARLSRLWNRRLEEDQTLQQQMDYSMSREQSLPALTVAPRVLRRSAAAEAAGAPRRAEPGSREQAVAQGPLPLFMQQQQQGPLMQPLEAAPPPPSPQAPPPPLQAPPPPLQVSPPPSQTPPLSLPGPNPGGTQDVSSLLAAGPAVPFRSGPPAIPAVAAPREGPPQRPANAGGTQDVGAALAGGAAIPFHGAAPPPVRQPVSEPPLRAPERAPTAPHNAAGTQDVSAALGEALPFAHEHERPSDPPAGLDHRPSFPMPFAQRPASPAAASAATGPAAQPAAAPALTVEQYASLCVELQMRPDPAGRAATLQRYRLAEAQFAGLSARYNDWLARDPGGRAAFERAAAAYRAWLSGQRR